MRRTLLRFLTVGTRFSVKALDVHGVLVMVNACRALVRIDGGSTRVQFQCPDGSSREFAARRTVETSWSPDTEVEIDVKAKKSNTSVEVATSDAVESKAPRLSMLDAAEKVLRESGRAMNTKEMIEAMATKAYWTSPGGKTPHATLYSAILREIQTKGDAGRFRKADKGTFQLAAVNAVGPDVAPPAKTKPKPKRKEKAHG